MRRTIAGIEFTSEDGEYKGRKVWVCHGHGRWEAGTYDGKAPRVFIDAPTQHEAVSRLKAALDWTEVPK